MMPAGGCRAVLLLLLLLSACGVPSEAADEKRRAKTGAAEAPAPKRKRSLTRSDGQRFERLASVIKSTVESETQRFLQERGQVGSAICHAHAACGHMGVGRWLRSLLLGMAMGLPMSRMGLCDQPAHVSDCMHARGCLASEPAWEAFKGICPQPGSSPSPRPCRSS